MKRLLSIAGSDPSGGAGIQADLKTFAAFGCYGMAAIAAITVQNTRGITRAVALPPDLVAEQIDSVLADIPVDAIKIGMLGEPETVSAVAASLRRAKATNLVVDPVLAPTLGAGFEATGLAKAIMSELGPIATLITPNIPEAARLLDARPAQSLTDMERQARALVASGARAALVTGGHLDGEPIDALYAEGGLTLFTGARVATRHLHGTGCALSSAIAAGLALELPLVEAIARAKRWLEGALAAGDRLELGAGAGPPDHIWNVEPGRP